MTGYSRASVICPILLTFVLVSGGCSKPTHESVQKDAIGKMNELAAILKGVTDEASAKAAVPKIKALGEDMKALKEQADALPKLSPEEQKTLAQKQEKETEDATRAMMKEMTRVMMNPALSQPIAEAMKDVQGKMAAP